MEFVLADEHGGKIHAAAKKKDIGRISKDLKVGEWRVLDNFQVAHATGQFRPTNSKWKMTMTLNTKVSTCSVKNDSQFLELIPIRIIVDGGLNHCILIDFIGQVLNVQEIQTVPVQGKEETLITKYWIIAVMNVLADAFGSLMLSSYMMHARKQMANRLPSDGLAIAMNLKEDDALVQLQKQQKADEWLTLDLKSVYDVKSSTEIEKFRIRAKVTAIDTDWGWYYFGCVKCQHRVFKDLKKESSTRPRPVVPIWYCDNCKTNIKAVSPKNRFKLHLIIEDDSGEAKIMLMDSVANGMIQDPELLPDSIKDLVGNTFDFLVGVEKEHIMYGNDTYKAHKVKNGHITGHSDSANEIITVEDDLSQIHSDNEASVVKSNGMTPSPKRSIEDSNIRSELSSTSKKQCTKLINLEDESNGVDVKTLTE
ncbi:unnamed protein product [Microthlaspi erraticum]|uniref:Replication protein A 70 kDa DNA-binding subunit B/D first OB fold domain-containing protein n=1 Tax=Microthlaspi erraticum TaxID=1685480 RepID=A0A6D2K2F9_9BRAS|nr:unnamed protein product [Microthlaspi erraticum]